MLKYLVILLDDTSVSYCHYGNTMTERCPMPLETLKRGLLFAMKENLMVQAVYPDYAMPEEYTRLISRVDHADIRPRGKADVVVIEDVSDIKPDISYVLRCPKAWFLENIDEVAKAIVKAQRLNVVITDIETLLDAEQDAYFSAMSVIAEKIKQAWAGGKTPQTNLLTDRLQLDRMNNCNAGVENITLAPNGNFYLCPAFYYDGLFNVGSLEDGVKILNQQLYKLEHSPICQLCDAYHCKRCVWLNLKTTLEVNTPSHEQCVAAHLERNALRLLNPENLKEIDYLDPFDTLQK